MEDPIMALTDPNFDPPDPVGGDFPAKPNAELTDLVYQFVGNGAYSFTFDGQGRLSGSCPGESGAAVPGFAVGGD
jgi:hypothetical protein